MGGPIKIYWHLSERGLQELQHTDMMSYFLRCLALILRSAQHLVTCASSCSPSVEVPINAAGAALDDSSGSWDKLAGQDSVKAVRFVVESMEMLTWYKI